MGEADFNPFDLCDFGCLRDEVEIACPAEEVNHVLFDLTPGGIGDDLPKTGQRSMWIEVSSITSRMAVCCSVSPGSTWPLGKDQWPAAGMFNQQQFSIAVILAEDDRAAGFFILHVTASNWPVSLQNNHIYYIIEKSASASSLQGKGINFAEFSAFW